MHEYPSPTLLPHCPFCGYDLEGMPIHHRCPECGQTFDRQWVLFGRPAKAARMAPLRIIQTLVLGGMSTMGWLWFWVGTKMTDEWAGNVILTSLTWIFILLAVGPMVAIFFVWKPGRRDRSVPFFVAIGDDEIVTYRAPASPCRIDMEAIKAVTAPFGEGVLEFEMEDDVVRVPYGQGFPATPNDQMACLHAIRDELQRRQARPTTPPQPVLSEASS